MGKMSDKVPEAQATEQTSKKCKQTKRWIPVAGYKVFDKVPEAQATEHPRKQTSRKCKQAWQERCSAILVTVTLADMIRRSGYFHSDHETFFSLQCFGGDALPTELPDTSLPVAKAPRQPVLFQGVSTVAECRADCRRLTICQVANAIAYDDAPRFASATDSHRSRRYSTIWI